MTFRGGYRRGLWAGVLLFFAVLLTLMFGSMALLGVREMAWGLLVGVGPATLAGLLQRLRPRTVVDFDSRRVLWGTEVCEARR